MKELIRKVFAEQLEAEKAKRLEEAFRLPAYNVAPTRTVPVVLLDGGRRVFDGFTWGLKLPWMEAGKTKIAPPFNARAEGIATSRMFRSALMRRRCIMLADGFYEWPPKTGAKQTHAPYFIRLTSGEPMGFAGIWEPAIGGVGLPTCTLITTEANACLRPFHHRMPVILQPAEYDAWLDPLLTDVDQILPFLRQFPAEEMIATEASRGVGSVRNNGPELLEPDGPTETLLS